MLQKLDLMKEVTNTITIITWTSKCRCHRQRLHATEKQVFYWLRLETCLNYIQCLNTNDELFVSMADLAAPKIYSLNLSNIDRSLVTFCSTPTHSTVWIDTNTGFLTSGRCVNLAVEMQDIGSFFFIWIVWYTIIDICANDIASKTWL